MSVEILNLEGTWAVRKNGNGKAIPATVPGDVYRDLLAADEIPDPFYRDNELALQWIGEADWSYTRTIIISKRLLSRKHVLLRCDGLDTFAKVSINGQCVAETDNMFRTYEWDVKSLLRPGENAIRVDFTSVLPYIEQQQKAHPGWKKLPALTAYAGWVRKEQCNFGWDWGIKAITCGIWRNIQLIAYDAGRLADVHIRQRHTKEKVDLNVDISIDDTSKDLIAEVVVLDGKNPVASTDSKVIRKKANVSLPVIEPKLWWPNTMGKQHLYTVIITLKNTDGIVIDSMTKRVGLRTIELDRHADSWGESFQFVVNGVPFFAKGANWIPVDAILSRRTEEDYRRLVGDAAECNMNMLRVWGGGIYEDDAFYDACDEHGICVWQDFMFACSAYPTFQKGFLANVRGEAQDAIKRLRHHPCLALWCGNNELEMMNVSDDGWKKGMMPWRAYKRLFDKLLPEQVNELSPDIPYWPSSPHSPRRDRKQHRSDMCGDAHLWIMTGRYPFDCARGMDHRFASEFGFQSFPEPKTVADYADNNERNIASRIMEHHQRAPGGNISMMQQMLKCLRMPVGNENTYWVSQIMQGTSVKNACEHFRRNRPRCMGALYWQLNDCWPVASWASIDFYGRWKALQYLSRHFFAPILISGVDNPDTKTVDIHLTNDKPTPQTTTVSWTITDILGRVLDEGSKYIKADRNSSHVVKTLKLQKLLKQHAPQDLLVWLEERGAGETSRNIVFLAPPKHMALATDPGIRATVSARADETFSVKLNSKNVALWTWLELDGFDARLSDNFIHLRPGVTETVIIRPDEKLTQKVFKKSLIIRSLVDTY